MTGDVHPDLAAMLVDIDTVRPHPDNPNHGDVDAIVESIEENGYYAPVVVQRATGLILAGSHRWHGLRRLGHTQIPVVWLDVDDERATRIMLADNRTTRLGHDDIASLVELLERLAESDGGLAGTAYGDADLSALIALANAPDSDPDDDERTNRETERATWPAVKVPPVLLERLRLLPGVEDADKLVNALDAYDECGTDR